MTSIGDKNLETLIFDTPANLVKWALNKVLEVKYLSHIENFQL